MRHPHHAPIPLPTAARRSWIHAPRSRIAPCALDRAVHPAIGATPALSAAGGNDRSRPAGAAPALLHGPGARPQRHGGPGRHRGGHDGHPHGAGRSRGWSGPAGHDEAPPLT